MRLEAWWSEAGVRPIRFEPLLVARDGERISVQIASRDRGDEAWCERLAQQLSTEWGCRVEVVEYPWPADPVDRVLAIWTLTGNRLAGLIGRDRLTFGPGGLLCRFPNPIAESLFRQWGGLPRMRRLWPQLPEWQQTVETPPPARPAPPEAVIMVREPVSRGIGQGVPAGEPIPLNALPSSGHVTVRGQIINVSVRSGRDGLRHLLATISDGQGAIRVRVSDRRKEPPVDQSLLQPGSWIKAAGILEQDKFTDETVVRIRDAGRDSGPPALADGEWGPRVELHSHTKMSAMDGITSLRDLFFLARELGHPALAIVDHGVLQTYPEAEHLAQETGIKAIYGVEVNMVEDAVAPLTGGPLRAPWGAVPVVVVDVETTGLSPRSHDIIEIGAAKVIAGEIVDTFHRMVRPTRAVSQTALQITGIQPEELSKAPDLAGVFADFAAFADGSVLAAHNARFDMGFLRAAQAQREGGDAWEVPVLDTLALARITIPGLKSYGLGPLSAHLKIPLSQHHRALADAEATAHLLSRLLAMVGEPWTEARLRASHPLSHTVARPVPVVLLLRHGSALADLYRLVSDSHLKYFHRVPRVPRSLVEAGRAGWWVGSPAHGGEVQDALLRHASPVELDEIAAFYDYWEVAPPDACKTLAREEHLDGEEPVRQWTRDLIHLGRRLARTVVAVSDTHYLRPDDRIYRDILAATAKGELHDAGEELHYRTSGEMQAAFAWLPEDDRRWVIHDAPLSLAESVPVIKPVPDGLYAPTLPEAERVVSQMPLARARELYGEELDPVITARLEKEIRSIVDNGFASIYYTAHRLVKKSLDDGYLVGSRGSVGSSLVATLLNITEVNPLPPHYRCPHCRFTEFVHDDRIGSGYDLPARPCPQCGTALVGDGQDIPFETFLGFEGDKVPDIDLNFSGEYQSEIHRYTEELFGRGYVFRAGTIATVAEKTAYGLVRAWAREHAKELTPAEVEWLAAGITGVKRTTGQHPGGLMVVPANDDIHRFSPVQHPADDRNSEVVTTHFDYHAIEGRLLKLDLLGHDDPTALRMLEDLTGVAAHSIPFQDPATMSLFRKVSALGVNAEAIGSPVGSLGIPEFGTRFVRGMLVDTQPETFAELVRISGLSHGTEVWTNNAQDLIRQRTASLSEVIATRDDIMLYLIARGLPPKTAFAISESVRKGKGLKTDQEQAMRAQGVPAWYVESCRKISYLFPKAHAVAYVMMGWRIAWYKVHHPLAYYATYFSVRAADFDPKVVLGGVKRISQALAETEAKGNEASPKERNLVTVLEIAREMLARRFGFQPIDLERSLASQFLIRQDALLIPFAALPGLGATAAQNIIAAREEAPFLSVDDLRQRARLSKSVIDLLRAHGALDGLGETSQLAFF
ncbi:MAG: PolC-type DNA polymerase III [Thermaerobacter sp.]|nr:PolC-type DNA polymerase III [Thermaerobacter sp.]